MVFMTQQVSIDELRSNLADIIGKVMYGNDRIVVKKYNRDAAVILSIDEYEKLQDPAKRFTKAQWDVKFKVFEKIQDRTKDIPVKEIEEDIAQAIKEVRAKKRKNK